MWHSGKMSQNGKKVRRKQSGYDVTKDLKVTMGRNVATFMGKMDVKYMSMNVTMRQNVTQFVLAKNAVDRMFTCDILPKKVFKTKCSGVDKLSVHLEIKCHSGRSER